MTLGPDLLLDEQSHDLDLDGGDAKMQISRPQGVKIRLLFFRGEWFLDVSKGIPYFQSVFVKNPNLDHVRTLYRREILDAPGVDNLLSLILDFDAQTRELDVSWEADSDQGRISGEVVPTL